MCQPPESLGPPDKSGAPKQHLKGMDTVAEAIANGLLSDLAWRGLIADSTHPVELAQALDNGPITLYCGFDPTADSLHVGSLIPLITLRRFQLAGHQPIALAGGATGMIGDPSGKSTERSLLDSDSLAKNVAGVRAQLAKLLDFSAKKPALLLDNYAWISPFSFLNFLRDVGKLFSVNQMLAKESVRARLEDRETGISYTEFSYMLLQAYDFYHLRANHQCLLQIGGTDQWGNITAGIDLVRKKNAGEAYGLTLPLLTNADGTKFGKTVAGAIWLDPKRTSVYRFYQFWIRIDDRDVIKFLKLFTFLNRSEIEALEVAHSTRPEAREAHTALARSMTDLLHGETARLEAEKATKVLFGGGLEGLSEAIFADLAGEIPAFTLPALDPGLPLVEALVTAGLATSKGQARKDIEGGGVAINNQPVPRDQAQRPLTQSDLLFGRHILLRKGKRNYALGTLTTV